MKFLGVSYFVSMFLFSGCAITSNVQDPVSLHTTHGYVFVDFPNGGLASTMRLTSKSEGSEHKLVKRMAEDNSLTFGAWLPEDTYTITEYWDQEVDGLPPVTVTAGRITNMGDLVPMDVGGYEFVLAPYHQNTTRDKLSLVRAEFRGYLADDEAILWTSDRVALCRCSRR